MASSGGSAGKKGNSKSSAAQARSEASRKAAATRKRNAEMSKAADPAKEAGKAEEKRQTREQAAVGDASERAQVQLEQAQPRPRKVDEKARDRRSKADVTIRGRFEPGQRVRLYKVRGPEQLTVGLGDELVCVKRVDNDRNVQFTAADGVEVGQRYIAVSHAAGAIRQARVTGKKQGEPQGTLTQPPVGYDAVRHADGVPVGERGQPKLPGPERVPDYPAEG